ncbi:hypothetical protein E4U30_005081 [Claviceps sp. LM220 group G6]|nr:hypothetical protein E4U30_005081 [Claviceps sp. LM220 group G6]
MSFPSEEKRRSEVNGPFPSEWTWVGWMTCGRRRAVQRRRSMMGCKLELDGRVESNSMKPSREAEQLVSERVPQPLLPSLSANKAKVTQRRKRRPQQRMRWSDFWWRGFWAKDGRPDRMNRRATERATDGQETMVIGEKTRQVNFSEDMGRPEWSSMEGQRGSTCHDWTSAKKARDALEGRAGPRSCPTAVTSCWCVAVGRWHCADSTAGRSGRSGRKGQGGAARSKLRSAIGRTRCGTGRRQPAGGATGEHLPVATSDGHTVG